MNIFGKQTILQTIDRQIAATSRYSEKQESLIEKRMGPQRRWFRPPVVRTRVEAIASLDYFDWDNSDNLDFYSTEVARQDRLTFLHNMYLMLEDAVGATVSLSTSEYKRITGLAD